MTSRRIPPASPPLPKPPSQRARPLFFRVSVVLISLLAPAVSSTLSATPHQQYQSPAPQSESKPVPLEPGKPLERQLKGGEKHTYEIHAESGQFLHAEVEQLGIDVALTLCAPGGNPIASMDSYNGKYGFEKISTIAEKPGSYSLEVASDDKHVPDGRYRVLVNVSRMPTEQDRVRIAAERLSHEAILFQLRGNAEAKRGAIKKFKEALPLWHTSGDGYEEAVTYASLARLYRSLGESENALDCDSQALTLERLVGDRFGEATTLNNMGTNYSALGEKRRALEYYAQVLPLERAMGYRSGEAITLSNIGGIYAVLGEMQIALEYYRQALPLHRALGERSDAAITLNNIGQVYDMLGEMQKALEYYHQALQFQRELRNRHGEAVVLDNIGLVYASLGERRKALFYSSQALQLERAVGDRLGEAVTLNNIGLFYAAIGEGRKALDYYNQALALTHALGDRHGETKLLNNIGVIYSGIGESIKALAYFNAALPLVRSIGDRLVEATTLHNIGHVFDALGQKEKGLENYNLALSLSRAIANPISQVRVLRDLMEIWRKQGHQETAVFFGKQAVNEIQQVRSNLRGLKADEQQSFRQSYGYIYRQLADILISLGRLSEAEQVLDLLKNEEYFQFVRRDARQAASLTAPVEFTKAESQLNRIYEERASRITSISNEWTVLQAKPSRTPEDEKHLTELSGQLEIEDQAWNKFLNGLQTEFDQSKQTITNEAKLQESASRMQQVVRELAPGIVALYTLASEDKYRVILVSAEKQVARESPIKAAELNKKVAAYRQALLDPRSDPAPQAQGLYQILVAPVAKDLEDAHATTLMWSLDGVLRYLPLAALNDGHEYLVEKYVSVVFTPASIALLDAHPITGERHGLGMGVSKSYGGMDALPAVPAELHAIIREAGTTESEGVLPGHMLLDDTFTTDNFKDSLSQKYELVHIASHFIYGAGNDTDSYLLLGGKDAQGQKLTLADINEDPKISFKDVELLTLSACNTAINVPGDGHEVDGLGMLAQRKGAKAVMATLWSVYDPSTSLLMQTFYRNWTIPPTSSASSAPVLPLSKAEALHRAQLSLLHGPHGQSARPVNSAPAANYSHPYYWAPFILIGNWQ